MDSKLAAQTVDRSLSNVTALPRLIRGIIQTTKLKGNTTLKRILFKFHLLLQIAKWLTVARWLMLASPFKTMADQMGTEKEQALIDQIKPSAGHQICGFLRKWTPRVALILPFKCKCLSQSYAAGKILQRYGIAYTIYFGVNKQQVKNKQKFKAHAWTVVGKRKLTGGRVSPKFTVINYFGWKPS